jgi:hypothetical protein
MGVPACIPARPDRGGSGLRMLLGAATLSLVVATPAVAAQGLSDGWSNADYSTKETRALTHAYARCVVKRQPAKASEAIVRNVDNGAILRDYRMLIRDDCLTRQVHQPTKMRFGGDLYRYALADALVNQELATQPVPDLEPVARLDHRNPGEPPQPTDAGGRKLAKRKFEAALQSYRENAAFAFLSRYGECVVRVDTAGAKALLVTGPDSVEEAARFAALRPALGRCLPEGETLRSGKAALRGSIAINYYRLAHASGAAR